jgi:hypothetical protein
VEKLNIAVIRVTNWYIDPIHFKLDYFPLDITFRADSEPTPFPEGITGYIGTTTQYPDDKQFLIKAPNEFKALILCFVRRPAMKLTSYIRLDLLPLLLGVGVCGYLPLRSRRQTLISASRLSTVPTRMLSSRAHQRSDAVHTPCGQGSE